MRKIVLSLGLIAIALIVVVQVASTKGSKPSGNDLIVRVLVQQDGNNCTFSLDCAKASNPKVTYMPASLPSPVAFKVINASGKLVFKDAFSHG